MGVLHQSPHRAGRSLRHRDRFEPSLPPGRSSGRLPRSRPSRRWSHLTSAGHGVGWLGVPLGLADDHRVVGRRSGAPRSLPPPGAASDRADPPSPAFPGPHLCHHLGGRVHRRPRHVRRHHFPASVPPGRHGDDAYQFRALTAAADGWRGGVVDRLRAADHPHRPVQDLPDRRHHPSWRSVFGFSRP